MLWQSIRNVALEVLMTLASAQPTLRWYSVPMVLFLSEDGLATAFAFAGFQVGDANHDLG